MRKPNVLFILVDQLRYDLFSYRNNKYIETPNIDRLANGGVSFENAICAAPLCGPSRAAILSGRYSKDNYLFVNREPGQEGPWLRDLKTYDEILFDNGYECVWNGKWHNGQGHRDCYSEDSFFFGHHCDDYHSYLNEKYDFPNEKEQKIDRYTNWAYTPFDVDDVMREIKGQGVYDMPHHNEAGLLNIEPEDSLTAWTVRQSIDYLNKSHDKPFSLTCSILHPHAPLLTTAKYADLYKNTNFPLPENIEVLAKENSPIPNAFSHENLREYTRLYYSLVKEVDDWVGELLNALENNNLTENTLVVFTADHGDLLGSHGTLSKKEFYEECLRVPLLMRFPQIINAKSVSKMGASGVDLAPTILECCGIRNIEEMDGKSLIPKIDNYEDEFVFSELRGRTCYRSNKWKIVLEKNECTHLYDLEKDKYEKNNIANVAEYKDIQSKLKKLSEK